VLLRQYLLYGLLSAAKLPAGDSALPARAPDAQLHAGTRLLLR
jgi:hypothetical protein